MTLSNSLSHYGSLARLLHWLTALLIFTTFPLGMIAQDLPFGTEEELARKVELFSIHKTLGVATFIVALLRVLWALTQPRPLALRPERRLETFLAEWVHWSLYASILIVPLSGWVHHAAQDGFAPILWPLGQNLPFVPKSETLAVLAGAMHVLATKILLVSVILHLLGALKHVIIDRDSTLSRMLLGRRAAPRTPARHGKAPVVAAVALYVLAIFGSVQITRMHFAGAEAAPTAEAPAAPSVTAPAANAGLWQVEDGSLSFTLRQMGSEVTGRFETWQAEIRFDEAPDDKGEYGAVTVTIDTTSLNLGAVTYQAKGADFFDVAHHPQAVFTAPIVKAGETYLARGNLALRGITQPVELPFTLKIEGNRAEMQGEVTLDRRDFEMGAQYGDEKTVGFAVTVKAELSAIR